MLRTKVDRLAELVERKPITVADAAAQLGAPADLIEFVARSLELEGVFQLSYPPVGSPQISLLKKLPFQEDKLPAAFDDKYSFVVQGIPSTVYVYRDNERRPFYHIFYPIPGPYTALFLETLKPDVAKDVPLESSYFLTPERMQAYLPIIFDKVKQKLSMYFSEHLEAIAGSVFISMYGMGEMELLMGDDSLEEVAVNTSRLPISVYHRKYGWMKTNLTIPDEDTIANVAAQIARRVGQQITIADPVLDAFLTTGDRATATLYPASTRGNTITIRKFAREPWTSTKFIQGHTYSSEMAALLWQATHYEMNIVATGGTASGKTSMLNTLMQLVPPFQRVVTIEETRELALPDHIWNWIPLLVRTGGPATEAEKVKITMADLLKTSLRMRPDRIVLGEVRSPDEAKVLFDAMQTGHSVSTTFHADSANQLITRMLEPPFSIHTAEAESIHLVVVQHRDRRRNIRRTFEISEIVPSMEGSLSTNRLFIWRPRTDMFEAVNKPRRYVEDINIFTGMTEREINEDLAQRKSILDWMCGQGYYDISQVSEVARAYYSTLDVLLDAVAKNGKMEGVPDRPLSQRALFSSAAVSVPSTAPQPARPMQISDIPSVSFGMLKEVKRNSLSAKAHVSSDASREAILKKADEGKAGKGRLQPRKGQPAPKGGKRR
jgi:flagellar protein FlaI